MKIGILGAGISGLSAAAMIAEAGIGEVQIFEKDNYPGGLASSRVIDGYAFDLHGGHVFNTKYDEVKRWVFARIPQDEWVYQMRKARSLFEGRVIDYPFEFALYQLSAEDGLKCLQGFKDAGKGDEPGNYYDWLIWKFGLPIAEKYMIPYNEKIMSYDLTQMSTRWVQGKMPLPSFKEVDRAFNAKDPTERGMPHSSFYYPCQGGIQTLINRVAEPLKDRITLGYPVECVERNGGQWVINGEYQVDRLISTISLKALVQLMPHAPSHVRRAGLQLRTNLVTTTLCECAPNDISWLYIPDKTVCLHRMVFQGGFSPKNCPDDSGMGSSVVLESTGQADPQAQVRDVNTKLGIDALRVGRVICENCSESYIVYDCAYVENLSVINSYTKSAGIYCLGRFAEWQYYNMDVCIKKAFEVVAQLQVGRKSASHARFAKRLLRKPG